MSRKGLNWVVGRGGGSGDATVRERRPDAPSTPHEKIEQRSGVGVNSVETVDN